MNYKLEKFWNLREITQDIKDKVMNYKLEKFWNVAGIYILIFIW